MRPSVLAPICARVKMCSRQSSLGGGPPSACRARSRTSSPASVNVSERGGGLDGDLKGQEGREEKGEGRRRVAHAGDGAFLTRVN